MLLPLLLVSTGAWNGPSLQPTRSTALGSTHTLRTPLMTAVAADPFASPVFLPDAARNAAAISPGVDFVQLVTVYVLLMLVLSGWEYYVLPRLQDAGLMPPIPSGLGSLSAVRKAKEEIFNVPWTTPLTMDRSAQLPSLAELQRDAYRIGMSVTDSGIRVCQYIRAHAQDAAKDAGSKVLMELAASEGQREPQLVPIKARFERGMSISDELGVCQLSKDFSELYGHKVYICKRRG